MRHGVVFTCYVDDLSFSGTAATPSFLWRVKQVVHHHRFNYHNDHCYRTGERKIVTGVMVAGNTLLVPPQYIEQMRQDERALDELGAADQYKALERLIGRIAAAADIDPRHRNALERLVARRALLRPGVRRTRQ
jgi:RNA-directed DNA polymerase